MNSQESVEAWLKKQGYPLEMRTARAFSRRGWFLHHSRRYRDNVSGKDREIDLLAFCDDPSPKNGIHGHFVIECKWSQKKPWVLFTSEQQSLNSIGHVLSTAMTSEMVSDALLLDNAEIVRLPMFSDIREGYGIVQAFAKDQAIDAAHTAVVTVSNAANFFAKDMSGQGHSIFFIPTVVFEGELFSCSLDGDANVVVKPLEIGVLLHTSTDDEGSNRGRSLVHIVRESALEMFIDRAEATFERIRRFLRPDSTGTSIG